MYISGKVILTETNSSQIVTAAIQRAVSEGHCSLWGLYLACGMSYYAECCTHSSDFFPRSSDACLEWGETRTRYATSQLLWATGDHKSSLSWHEVCLSFGPDNMTWLASFAVKMFCHQNLWLYKGKNYLVLYQP